MLAEVLRTLVLTVWLQLHPGMLPPEAGLIADALVEATLARAGDAPALDSHELELVAAAVWIEHESGIQLAPHPDSWDSRANLSCGAFQERCSFVRTHTLTEQATLWLDLLRWGVRACPASPLAPLLSGSCHRGRRLADWRIAKARALLTAAP